MKISLKMKFLFCLILCLLIGNSEQSTNNKESSTSTGAIKTKNNERVNCEIQKSFISSQFLIDYEFMLTELSKLDKSMRNTNIQNADKNEKGKIRICRFFICNKSKFVKESFEKLNKCMGSDYAVKEIKVSFLGRRLGRQAQFNEWFDNFSAKVFHPDFGLFKYSNDIDDIVEINPQCRGHHPQEYLCKFKILGVLTGAAIYQKSFLHVYFSTPFLKAILRQPVQMDDIERTDGQFYKTLLQIKDNPDGMNLDFTDDNPRTGKLHNLKQNGENIPVDNQNKIEYIDLLLKWKYEDLVKNEMSAFIEGFSSVIPLHLIQNFNEHELQFMISGEQKIDLKKLQEIVNFQDCGWLTKRYFWNAVENMDNTKRSLLLQYVTGVTRIPFNRKFNFTVTCLDKNEHPIAHTCSGELEIPVPRINSTKRMTELLNDCIELFQVIYQKHMKNSD